MNVSPSPLQTAYAVLRYFFRSMTGAYALSVVLFLMANIMIGENHWGILSFFNAIAHLLWMPALILLPLTLVLREWRVSVMLLPAVIAFLVSYVPFFVPDNVPIEPDTTVLRVLTYNVSALNQNPDAVVAFLRDADADLVALQEVSTEIAPVLRDQLGRDYPYIALHPQERAIAGQGILSRYPILEDLYWQHDEERMLGHQRAEINLPDGRTIVFYNAHPVAPMSGGIFFDPRWRDQDIESLLMLLNLETSPLLVAGDFNLTDQNRMYARLTTRLRDAYREVGDGMGWTFPNTTLFPPVLRIDYVFYSRHWTAHTAQVLSKQGGSDHLPLLVTVSLSD